MSDGIDGSAEHVHGKTKSHVKVGDHERAKLDHLLYTDPGRPPDTIGIDPEDGLPRPVAGTSLQDSLAPPLSPETLICMADLSTFVLRDRWQHVVCRIPQAQVERMEDGRYRTRLSVVFELGAPLLDILRSRVGRWCVVAPLRPQCDHYRRQLVPPGQENPGLRTGQTIRYCLALRDENGEYIDLSNSELVACEMRSPSTQACSLKLDAADEERVRIDRKNAEQNAEFDVNAALDKDAGGIFSTEGSSR